MPISLDTLLFWCGLALLCVGLFVFLTGKKASDDSKKESNRFEAFGIKIDVNNPSLILIMLGVVMMLSPKFIPQEVKQAAAPDLAQEEAAEKPSSAAEIPSPPAASPALVMESALAADPAAASTGEPPSIATPTPPSAQAASGSAVANADSHKASPSSATAPPASAATPIPAPAKQKPKAQPPRQLATLRPIPAKTVTEPKPAPVPEPVAQKPTAAPQPPPTPPALMVAVVADVSDRAGIRETAEAYAQRASGVIAQRAGEIFDNKLVIDSATLTDLRDHLQRGEENYAALCEKWRADILILGDFKIVTGYSTIDSAHWPDYHLHLYNCATRRSSQEVFKHLNPSNQDSFPFQAAISAKTVSFLTQSRWVVGN